MSDPEDSDSFLSADDRGPDVRDSGDVSSDVTLSSDSEPETSNTNIYKPAKSASSNTEVSKLATSNTEVFKPATSNADVSKPAKSNTEVFKPATSNTDVSKPAKSNMEVFKPATSNTDVYKPVTFNAEVSKPATSNTKVSEPATSNTKVPEPSEPEKIHVENSEPSGAMPIQGVVNLSAFIGENSGQIPELSATGSNTSTSLLRVSTSFLLSSESGASTACTGVVDASVEVRKSGDSVSPSMHQKAVLCVQKHPSVPLESRTKITAATDFGGLHSKTEDEVQSAQVFDNPWEDDSIDIDAELETMITGSSASISESQPVPGSSDADTCRAQKIGAAKETHISVVSAVVPAIKKVSLAEKKGPMTLGAKKLTTEVADVRHKRVSKSATISTVASEDETPLAAKSACDEQEDSWGAWESWGSSLLSSARDVTRTVLDTVESGIGAPDPEQLARIQRQEEKNVQLQRQHERGNGDPKGSVSGPAPAAVGVDEGGGLGSWLGGVSRVSSLMVSTGLDTLELIGKRTMDVLQDDQLGLRQTVTQLGTGSSQPSLAQTLRERSTASTAAGDTTTSGQGRSMHCGPVTFVSLFNSSDGSAHMEALEMLSTRCGERVSSVHAPSSVQRTLDAVQGVCCTEGGLDLSSVNVDNFDGQLKQIMSGFNVPLTSVRLSIAHSSWRGPLQSTAAGSAGDLRYRAISAAAQLAAGLVELCHKLAELWLTAATVGPEPLPSARRLQQLVALTTAEVDQAAALHVQLVNQSTAAVSESDVCTDIFLETSYCRELCRDVLRLMCPVVQIALVLVRSSHS